MTLNPLTAWLGSLPGCFVGKTEREALERAYRAYQAHGGGLDYDAFVLALDRAGYSRFPQYMNRDTNQLNTRIQLPDRQPDMESGGGKAGEGGRRVRPFWKRSEPTAPANLDHLE